MKESALSQLACPGCGGSFSLRVELWSDDDIESGSLRCSGCGTSYPILRHVPRFVPLDNYAATFGFQWNRFRRTQLDSHSGTTITRDRFVASTGWKPEDLEGKRVLDVGCGAGRFAEIALSFGAELFALDYSSAVDACWSNLGANPRLTVVQGDVYRLPFPPASFDFIYCLGVLQHTPDVEGAFKSLPARLRPGGRLAVDVYGRSAKTLVTGKYLVRPWTRRMKREDLFGLVERSLPSLLTASRVLGMVPVAGRKLRQLVPVSNYEGELPLTPEQHREWALLDTFDMLSPEHDHPQTPGTLRRWFGEAGLVDTSVFKHGHVVGRGRRP